MQNSYIFQTSICTCNKQEESGNSTIFFQKLSTALWHNVMRILVIKIDFFLVFLQATVDWSFLSLQRTLAFNFHTVGVKIPIFTAGSNAIFSNKLCNAFTNIIRVTLSFSQY